MKSIAGRIKKGDQVFVISGKERGREGKVLKVYSKEGRILVEGLNLRKRHQRPRRAGEKGGIVSMPTPLAASQVMPKCSRCGRGVRVGFKTDASGLKSRFCRKCQGEF